jgi:hypothetical protein
MWVAIELEPGENQKVSIGVFPKSMPSAGTTCDLAFFVPDGKMGLAPNPFLWPQISARLTP